MKKLAVAAAALFVAAPLLAQETPNISTHEFPLQMASFLELHPEVTPDVFAQIDQNGDGQVTAEEYEGAVNSGLIADAATE